jgi:hypothetical protein
VYSHLALKSTAPLPRYDVKHLSHPTMQQGHGAHDAGLVRDEQTE